MEKVTKALGDWAQKVAKAALGTPTGARGGYLVPIELQLRIETVLRETGIFHRFAVQQPMASKECIVPSFDINASHATGSSPLYGGMMLKWSMENTTIIDGGGSFVGNTLVAKDLEAGVVCSNQLVADGGEALGAFLEHGFAAAIEWAVENACFSGNGLGRPLGIINASAAAVVTRAGGNDVAQVDLAKMVAALIPACYQTAIWACNPTVLAKVCNLSVYSASEHQPTVTGLVGVLFGRPLFVTEKLPPLGFRGDIVLFDPRQYVLGTRNVEVAASQHILFTTNQTVYRLVWRGDGQPIPRGTALLADGSTTSGVIVVLSGDTYLTSGGGGGGGGSGTAIPDSVNAIVTI